MALVTEQQARAHLREADDADVSIPLGAAEEQALEFLNRAVYETPEQMAAAVLDGSAGLYPMVCNKSIQAAILLTVGHLWANRENAVVGPTAAAVELPFGAQSLLWPFRKGLGV
jgi:hypothetical protein